MKTKTLKVTAEIKKLFTDGGKVKAAASLTIEGVFVVRSVRLVEGSKGLFVSMPSRKNADGEYKDICFPINNDVRAQIQSAVVTAYENALREQNETADTGDGEADGGEQESA